MTNVENVEYETETFTDELSDESLDRVEGDKLRGQWSNSAAPTMICPGF